MEKKHVLLALVMIMSLGLNTGCKNESKRLVEPEAKVQPESISPDSMELSALEKAKLAKAASKKSLDELAKAIKAEREAKANRDKIQEALAVENDVIIHEELSQSLWLANAEIAGLEKEVELNNRIVTDKRALLDKELENLTIAELAEVGEADVDLQVAFNQDPDQVRKQLDEMKVRLEIAYEAQKVIVENQQAAIDALNKDLKIKAERIELAGDPALDAGVLKALSEDFLATESRRHAAMQQLSTMIALQENLAAAISKY